MTLSLYHITFILKMVPVISHKEW